MKWIREANGYRCNNVFIERVVGIGNIYTLKKSVQGFRIYVDGEKFEFAPTLKVAKEWVERYNLIK